MAYFYYCQHPFAFRDAHFDDELFGIPDAVHRLHQYQHPHLVFPPPFPNFLPPHPYSYQPPPPPWPSSHLFYSKNIPLEPPVIKIPQAKSKDRATATPEPNLQRATSLGHTHKRPFPSVLKRSKSSSAKSSKRVHFPLNTRNPPPAKPGTYKYAGPLRPRRTTHPARGHPCLRQQQQQQQQQQRDRSRNSVNRAHTPPPEEFFDRKQKVQVMPAQSSNQRQQQQHQHPQKQKSEQRQQQQQQQKQQGTSLRFAPLPAPTSFRTTPRKPCGCCDDLHSGKSDDSNTDLDVIELMQRKMGEGNISKPAPRPAAAVASPGQWCSEADRQYLRKLDREWDAKNWRWTCVAGQRRSNS